MIKDCSAVKGRADEVVRRIVGGGLGSQVGQAIGLRIVERQFAGFAAGEIWCRAVEGSGRNRRRSTGVLWRAGVGNAGAPQAIGATLAVGRAVVVARLEASAGGVGVMMRWRLLDKFATVMRSGAVERWRVHDKGG